MRQPRALPGRKATLTACALTSVAAGLLFASGASGSHIPGATYTGTVTPSGTISFAVSSDGLMVDQLSLANVPGDACLFTSVTFSGGFLIDATHSWSTGGTQSYVTGSFLGAQGAQGALRLTGTFPSCDTGVLSWTATTQAQPPPPPPPPIVYDVWCRVPNVIGRSLARAKKAIRHAGCTVGRIRRVASPKPVGHVIAQSPPPRKIIVGRPPVNLVVSRGRR